MSAIVAMYDRSNQPLEPGVVEGVMARLSQRGPDGHALLQTGSVALGHWHFWTTLEEVGEEQPLQLPGLPFALVFDGRLDNRAELLERLQLTPQAGVQISDAALVLMAYDRWGETCFLHFLGEYAFVLYDEHKDELFCGRDALGDRTLFYSFKGSRLIVASEPWALAGADGPGAELDEDAVAMYFSFQMPADGRSLFKNISELPPACVMSVSPTARRTWRTWQPDLATRLVGLSDEEYGSAFRTILEESVTCRLRTAGKAGILMSGGLDSSSVACLAARALASEPLTTVSYVFDELAECDERRYIEMMKEKWGLASIQMACDDAWPYRNWAEWPMNPNQREGNPYRLLKERAYGRAREEGLQVLLTGGFGDQLYSAGKEWLADLLEEGKYSEALNEGRVLLNTAGLKRTWRAGFAQRALRKGLGLREGSGLYRRKRAVPPWLTPSAAARLAQMQANRMVTLGRHGNLLGAAAAASCSGEIPNASRHGIELRHPFRDRRLVEFVCSLPAYQLFAGGMYKHILRTAMQGLLPEAIRVRNQPTSLESLFVRGLEREEPNLRLIFQNEQAAGRQYVRTDWLTGQKSDPGAKRLEGASPMLSWLYSSYETWYKYVTKGNHGEEIGNA